MPGVRRICVGRIGGPHGVRGNVRLASYTEVPEDLIAYRPVTDESGRRTFEIELVGGTRGQLVGRIAGVGDRDAAEALRGVGLYVLRSALPEAAEDEFYHADLIGMAVSDGDGSSVGVVRSVFDFGAGDVLEVERPDGDAIMVPFTRRDVPEVDVAARRLVVVVPSDEAVADDDER